MTLRSAFYNKTVAEQALHICLPGIRAILEKGGVKRNMLSIVIGCRCTDGEDSDSKIYTRHDINREDWPSDRRFDLIAIGKFETACETGLTGKELVHDKPWLAKPHHVKWAGAAVQDNIVVTTSGCTANEDRMFAEMILAAIKCLVREKARARLEGAGDTFSEPEE